MEPFVPKMPEKFACQELLRLDTCSHMGWLRKQKDKSVLNKLLSTTAPKVYVVLAESCLYYYKNENDKEPKGKYPLYGYDSVQHYADELYAWSFVINHKNTTEDKIKFSASSQNEMVEWIRWIESEIIKANNNMPCRSLPEGSSSEGVKVFSESAKIEEVFYDDIDLKKVMDEKKIHEKNPAINIDPGFIPQLPINKYKGNTNKRASHTELKPHEYDYPSETEIEQMNQHPYVPTRMISNKRPEIQEQSMDSDYWMASKFDGPKEISMKLLNALKQNGAYLIRDSDCEIAPKTLIVYCEKLEKSLKYQIFHKDKPEPKYYLKKEIEFDSLEELIYHYFHNYIVDEYKTKLLFPYKYISNWKKVLNDISKRNSIMTV
ncbi:uncharacterized protein LOC115232387 isoform X1 [Argonauta hians]